jgi:succinate dehydrogenase / fumarate reductase flavoprotein subunit
MQSLVGIFRTEEDLVTALGELEKLKQRAAKVRVEGSRLFNPGWHLVRDLQSMLTISEAVARSAQARKESRGAHSRIDHPNADDKVWGKQNNVISREADGSMKLRQIPVKEMPAELQQILAEEK